MEDPSPDPVTSPAIEDAASISVMRHPKACRQCAVTKIKCTYRSGSAHGDPCDRCRRLGKDCQVQQPTPGPRKRRMKETRVAQLEKKIDGLFNLLNQSRDTNEHNQMATPASSTTQSTGPAEQHSDNNQLPLPDASSIEAFVPVDSETENMLARFRDQMAPFFPFVYVPGDKSASEIRAYSPLLFKEIITTASWGNLALQREQQKRLVAEFVQRLMLRGDKTLQLLQALLVLLSWYQPYMFAIPQLTNLLHLAFALVVDMGLNRAPMTREKSGVDNFTRRMAHGEFANRTHDSGDHMRALLGCYYVYSVLSKSFRAMDGPRFTPYMEECCKKLLEAKESHHDTRLVHMIRIQQFSEELGNNSPSELEQGHSPAMKAPLGFYVASMAARIKELKAPFENTNIIADLCVLVAAGAAEIHLYEYAYFVSLRTHSGEWGGNTSTSNDYLYQCLQAISETMRIHCKIPPAEFFKLTMLHWAHMSEMVIIMFKLFRSDGGSRESRAHMYQVVDPIQLLDELHNRFAAANKEAGLHADNELFIYISRRVAMFKSWLQDRPAPFASTSSQNSTPQMTSSSSSGMGNMDWSFVGDDMGPMNAGLFAEIDDGFWQTFLESANQPQPQPLPRIQLQPQISQQTTPQQEQRQQPLRWDVHRTFTQTY